MLADSLVAKAIEIIKYFQARNPEKNVAWFVENPDSSQLWSRDIARDLNPHVRLDYCQYGTAYRKRTRIATNAAWTPRPLCDKNTCPSVIDGRHVKSAQKGPTRENRTSRRLGDTCSLDTLHALPRALTGEILAITQNLAQGSATPL